MRSEATRAGIEVVEPQAGVGMRVEVVTAHQVRGVGLVVHDGVDVVDVVAHVHFNGKPLGVEGHERFLVAREPHVEADTVRANLLEK